MKMGSLPNLNDLHSEKAERRDNERDRELARERARELEFSREREKDRLPIFIHQTQLPKHHQHHRHSLTSRKVLRTRSSGATHHLWDDPMIEHMAAYSPISSRSHRTGIAPVPYHMQTAAAVAAANRRRESVNSSIGATSVRRLLTVNRGCRHKIPIHVKAKVLKNFMLLIIAHGMMCAALMPVVGLQGSSSTWFRNEKWVHFGPDIGSILLSICFFIASVMSLLTTKLINKLGYVILLAASYAGFVLFLSAHLYPSIYTLLPGYIIFGATLGPAWVGKLTLVVSLACKLSCVHPECNSSSAIDSLEDHKILCNRDESVRKLARWFNAAQDFGLIIGALIATFILTCASSQNGCFLAGVKIDPELMQTTSQQTIIKNDTLDVTMPSVSETKSITSNISEKLDLESTASHEINYYNYQDDMENINDKMFELFDTNNRGERICGAISCPVFKKSEQLLNYTNFETTPGAIPLMSIFLMFGIIALILTCFLGNVENIIRYDPVRGLADTIIFAGPLAFFIGTEQGYMLADFTKAYVSCSLGPQMVAGAFVGMGIMQLIASCTLSMLLRHTKRIVVIVAGFFFHACLLLVLSSWKPSKDDSALFYVIAASWGVCNAVWETLCFALVTITHTNHISEVSSQLQGLKFLGLGLTFAAHGFLCEAPKILVLAILLVITVPPYAMLEQRLEAQRKIHLNNL